MPHFIHVSAFNNALHDAGCELLYLPPYSPDLNKIEKCWSWLKSQIRKQLEKFDCLRDAPLGCLTFNVLTALAVAILGSKALRKTLSNLSINGWVDRRTNSASF